MEIEELINKIGTYKRCLITAPAGHGKTYTAVQLCKQLDGRVLLLTHTNAGVHALRKALVKQSVPTSKYSVRTIDSLCLTFSQSYPKLCGLDFSGFPKGKEQWRQLRNKTLELFRNPHVLNVLRNSYDFILVDEYQDCTLDQHQIVMGLSEHVSACALGDPMQTVFGWASDGFKWKEHVEANFEPVAKLSIPHRWVETNFKLGETIAKIREKLHQQEEIRWSDYSETINTIIGPKKPEDVTNQALSSNRGLAVINHAHQSREFERVYKNSRGVIQPSERVDLPDLIEFAKSVSGLPPGELLVFQVLDFLKSIYTNLAGRPAIHSAFSQRNIPQTGVDTPLDKALMQLLETNDALTLLNCFKAVKLTSQNITQNKPAVKRKELLSEAVRALQVSVDEPHINLRECAERVRLITSRSGLRKAFKKVQGSPLLLKGLQFDEVIVLYPEDKMSGEDLYVSLSRARHKVTVYTTRETIKLGLQA